MTATADAMGATATISSDGHYRYRLGRWWTPTPADPPNVDLWVMLNPSTADASVDDPTIRRCIGFSRGWGADGLRVVNLYALRSTDPTALLTHPDPVGPHNNEWLAWCADRTRRGSGRIVLAWGAHQAANGRRTAALHALTRGAGPLWCLDLTKSGAPRHPLYVPADTQPQEYRP